ncbi:hypothetical protein BDR04DRAFT_1138553 [Suillus decipiens]|nr:hypothetical protein BDR04DRAFT_1138553 [Suillus decipiens]
MAPNSRHTISQKKAEDVIREAKFTAAIQAIREKKTKNLRTAAAEFKVSYHTLHRRARNLTKPHSKAHKNSQLLTEGQEATGHQLQPIPQPSMSGMDLPHPTGPYHQYTHNNCMNHDT